MRSTVLFSCLVGIAAAAQQPTIFGLGSSYAQGPGLSRPVGRVVADLLNNRTAASTLYAFTNLAIGGTNLTSVTTAQAPRLSGQNVAAAYMVSGGNDLNYVKCLYDNLQYGYCYSPTLSQQDYINNYTAALNAIRDATAGLATPPPIFAVTYITALGKTANTTCWRNDPTKSPTTNPACPFDQSQVTAIKNLYNTMVDWTVTAIGQWQNANPSRTLTPIWMRGQSGGHEVGSSAPWINGGVVGCGGITWHPNDYGAIAVATYINQTLGNSLQL